MYNPRLERIRQLIHEVPHFPKHGVMFRDITPLLADPLALQDAIELLAEAFLEERVGVVLGAESRGFLFGVPLALRLSAAFVPVRKMGKLPRACDRAEYALEYGTDALEMHKDALVPGSRAVVVDDVLATGGTARAAVELARRQGAEVVGAAFLIEIASLNGRGRLEGIKTSSVISY